VRPRERPAPPPEGEGEGEGEARARHEPGAAAARGQGSVLGLPACGFRLSEDRPVRWLGWLDAERSTRALGLLRILLVLLAWGRWAYELLPYHDLAPDRLLLSAAFFATTTWMLVGWWGRLATAATGAVLAVMIYGYGRTWGVEDWTHHHTTLIGQSILLLALTPCSTSFSVDRWLAVSRAERDGLPVPLERGPTWATHLIALQVSTVYFWSAFDKTTIPFLSGARLEQIFVSVYWQSDFTCPGWLHACFMAAAILTVALEYVLPIGLWIPRLRPVLIPVGLVLHALFYTLIPVATFSATMAALYLAFLDPDAFHAWSDRLLRPAGAGRTAEDGAVRSG
jgi:hypothetical protein